MLAFFSMANPLIPFPGKTESVHHVISVVRSDSTIAGIALLFFRRKKGSENQTSDLVASI